MRNRHVIVLLSILLLVCAFGSAQTVVNSTPMVRIEPNDPVSIVGNETLGSHSMYVHITGDIEAYVSINDVTYVLAPGDIVFVNLPAKYTVKYLSYPISIVGSWPEVFIQPSDFAVVPFAKELTVRSFNR